MRHRTNISTAIMLCLAVLLIGGSAFAQGLTWVWNGGDGAWNDSSQWTPFGVPKANDFVEISAGTVTLDQARVVVGGTFSGGIITGNRLFQVNGPFNWTGGTFATGNEVQMTTNGVLTLTGNNVRELSGGLLNNMGGIILSGNNAELLLTNGAELKNTSVGTIEFQGNGTIACDSTVCTLNNQGMLKKSSGGGTSLIEPVLISTATINVGTGELLITRSSQVPISGTTIIAAGAELTLSGDSYLANNVQITGGGTLKVLDATLRATGFDGLLIDASSTLSLVHVDALLGGDGPIVVAGTFDWQRGTVGEVGTLVVIGDMNMINGGTRTVDQRKISLRGNGFWTGTQDIRLQNNGIFEVFSTGVFTIDNNEKIILGQPATGTLLNNGTISKVNGIGTTTIEVPLENNGVFEVVDGRVLLMAGGTATGTFATQSTGITEFSDGTYLLNGATFSGMGELRWRAPTLQTTPNGFTVAADGRFDFSGTSIVNQFVITNNGEFNFTKGTISGVGSINSSGSFNFTGAGTKNVVQQSININNSGVLDGTGTLRLDNQGTVKIGGAATFEFLSNAPIELFNTSGLGNVINNGSLIKSVSGVNNIEARFVTHGTLTLNDGVLNLSNGVVGDNSSGSVFVGSGANITYSRGDFPVSGLSFGGTGTVDITSEANFMVGTNGVAFGDGITVTKSGGDTQFSGAGNVIVNGHFNWLRGIMQGTGSLVLNNTANVESIDNKVLDTWKIINNGTLNWNGGNLRQDNASEIINNAGAVINLNTPASFTYRAPGGGLLTNQGIINNNASSYIDVIVDNQATIDAVADTMIFSRQLTNQASGIIRGNGLVDVSQATFANNGTVNPGASPGRLTFKDNYKQSATGELNIELGGTTPAVDYDQLVAQSAAELNGTLNISFVNGFFPTIGQTFDIITYTSRIDTFDVINAPSFGDIAIFDITYEPDRLRLTTINDDKISMNLRIFLQGAYTTGGQMATGNNLPLDQPFNAPPWNYNGNESVSSIPAGVVDWVLLEIRTSQTDVLATRAGFLKTDGKITELDGSSLIDLPGQTGTYYIAVYHRNHLAVMTATAINLGQSSQLYDFSTSQAQAFGSDPMIEVAGGVFALPGGDGNADGSVTESDMSAAWQPFAGRPGYLPADFNLNGQVQNDDKNLVWKSALGKTSQVP